jgi:hypothetical protein
MQQACVRGVSNRSYLLSSPEKGKFRRLVNHGKELLLTAHELRREVKVIVTNLEHVGIVVPC